MEKFQIVTDSCSDLPLEIIKRHNIHIIPLNVHFKHETFANLPDQSQITNKQFYGRLRNKQVAKTSQINPEDFIREVEPLLKQGRDLLVITLSSALSGSYNSMRIGREEMLEKYPNRSIILIDSLSASLGEGLLVYKAVQKANEGADLETTAAYVESIKLNNLALFTVDELGTLLRGGRISLTKALLGTLLNMKPALKVDDHGKLVPFSKARGRKNAINEILNAMDQKITDTDTVFISHADSVEEALRFKEEIEKRHPDIKEIVVGEIGPVIGAHAGPGTLAVFFFGSAR